MGRPRLPLTDDERKVRHRAQTRAWQEANKARVRELERRRYALLAERNPREQV